MCVCAATGSDVLPAPAAAAAAGDGAGAPHAAFGLAGPEFFDQWCGAPDTVLVADDQPLNRVVLAAQATSLGYSVLLAHDGEDAVALFAAARRRLAAVLLDLQMPRLDGWGAAAAMRALEAAAPRPRGANSGGAGGGGAGRRVAIVACTAAPLDGAAPCAAAPPGATVRQHALACGADAVAPKPIATEALRALLAGVLDNPEGARGGGGGDARAGEAAPGGGEGPSERASAAGGSGGGGGGAASDGGPCAGPRPRRSRGPRPAPAAGAPPRPASAPLPAVRAQCIEVAGN